MSPLHALAAALLAVESLAGGHQPAQADLTPPPAVVAAASVEATPAVAAAPPPVQAPAPVAQMPAPLAPAPSQPALGGQFPAIAGPVELAPPAPAPAAPPAAAPAQPAPPSPTPTRPAATPSPTRSNPTATPILRPVSPTRTPSPTPTYAVPLGPKVPEQIRRWEPQIQQAAKKHKLDPRLLAALVMTESSGDADAVSPAGAIGLVQVLDGPTDPAENLDRGAAILAEDLMLFDGEIDLALAAYNSGPPAVRAAGGVPPFPETEAHVARTLASYDAYRAA